MPDDKPQIEKFKEAARELECDDDEERFKTRIAELVKTPENGAQTKKPRQ